MVDSFNYAFKKGSLPITQKLGVISLIPMKDKDKTYLKNWRPISRLNNDYKIATKAIAPTLRYGLANNHQLKPNWIRQRKIYW